jgi:hypothetical protein
MRLTELRRQGRVIANFAEFLAEDVQGDPARANDAREALAALSKCDLELLAHARTEVHRREELPAAMKKNRYAAQLLDLVDRAA